jgi:hypothetical protein
MTVKRFLFCEPEKYETIVRNTQFMSHEKTSKTHFEEERLHTPPPDGPGADSSIGSGHRTLPNRAQKPQTRTSPLISSRPWHLVLLRRISSRRSSFRRSASPLVAPFLGRPVEKVGGRAKQGPGK